MNHIFGAARKSSLFAGVFIASVFAGTGRGAATPACTVHVSAVESIQDKIDAAQPGAAVCVHAGTYKENLLIRKDGIKLIGAGPAATILEPPDQPRSYCIPIQIPPVGEENFGVNGICVADPTHRVTCFGQ